MMPSGLFLLEKLREIFLAPGSDFSLASLLCALCIAVLAIGWRRHGKRQIRLKVLLRAIFPKRVLASRSTRADIGFFLFNSFVVGNLFGWAVFSYHVMQPGDECRPDYHIRRGATDGPARHADERADHYRTLYRL